jgi:hypothetical membrane protein
MKSSSQIPDARSRIAALSGVAGPLIIALGMLISILGYTGAEGQAYRLQNHFVSELGQVGISDLAPVFNLGLVIGGILNTIFLVQLALLVPGWPRYPVLVLGAASSLSGMLVGFFPMNNLGPHIFWALAFFNLGMVVALVYSLLFLLGRGGPFPRWLALPGLLNTAAFFWFNNFPSEMESGADFQGSMEGLLANRPPFLPLAALEWAVVLGILIWFLMISGYLILSRQKSD